MIQGMPMSPARDESAALDAALQGDESAFRELVEPNHAGLHAHCYQMLASVQDAEDALQEALLKAWMRLSQFERRASFRTWVYTIATRTALDMTARKPMRVLPLDDTLATGADREAGKPVSEIAWLEPYPTEHLGVPAGYANPEARYELRESVELAFVAAVQHLAPRQRAVLLLREVLGFSAQETAGTLEMTVAAVNSALERARAAIAQRCPDPSQQATLRSLGDAHAQSLVARYMDALDHADLHQMLDLLVEDASWAMPPETKWYGGREAVTGFLVEDAFSVRWRHAPTVANGQLAVGCYIWDAGRGLYQAEVLDVLTLRGPRISAVTAFIDRDIFPSFGLPVTLDALPEDGPG
jgi:RNA polymerase sigma-70 factor (ECF subfamily)